MSNGMSSKKYQEAIAKFAVYPKSFALEYLTMGLASEAGEVAGKAKKLIRGDYTDISEQPDSTGKYSARIDLDSFHADLHKEIGDVLWYAARLCAETGTTMEKVMKDNYDKLEARVKANTVKGSGDNR